MLPLHLAAIYHAPPGAVGALLQAYPEGAAEHDGVFEWLPLSLAAKYQAEAAVLLRLLEVHPVAAREVDEHG